MAQEFHFQHHRLEATRNRTRMAFALLSIFVATAAVGVQRYISTADTLIQVNDATLGTGLNQFEYSGAWGTDTPAGAFNSDNHFTDTVGGYYQVRFSGTQIKIYAEKSSSLGIIGVSIDGGSELLVDPYAATRVEQQLVYTSPALSNTNHILKVRNTGNTNAAAKAAYMTADRVDITAAAASTPLPTPRPTPTPTPRPSATPAPTSRPTAVPVSTQVPARTATPAPDTSRSTAAVKATPKPVTFFGMAAPAAKPVEDTTPTVPGDLEAMVTGDNAIITLRWKASTAGTGITGYHVERTSDGGNTWSVLSNATPDLVYMDNSAAFSVHYTYRVSAVSQSGKVSGYATVDATTGNFVVTSVVSKTGNFYSDDRLAAAEVPAGTLSKDANCSLVTMPVTLATSARKVVAGAYAVVCKDAGGKVLSEFAQPIKWTITVKGKLGGVSNPDAAAVDIAGAASGIPGAAYDPQTQIIRFNQSSASLVAVVGDVSGGSGIAWIITFGILLLAGAGFVVLLRRHQFDRYHDYLLQKYYNL